VCGNECLSGGFDYHLPIKGGIGTMPGRLHVAHIAVEMAPVAKASVGAWTHGAAASPDAQCGNESHVCSMTIATRAKK
jgi:hypothetical protein